MKKNQFFIALLIWLCMIHSEVFAGTMGIIIGEPDGVRLLRNGQEQVVTSGTVLVENDVLKGGSLKKLSVQLHPCARMVFLNDMEAKLVFSPLETKSMWQKVKEYMGFVEYEPLRRETVTRDNQNTPFLPGLDVALLSAYPVTFSWVVEGATAIEWFSEQGSLVYRKNLEPGIRSIEIEPKEFQKFLRPGGKYYWHVIGIRSADFKIRMVSSDLEATIMSGLDKIAHEASDINQQNIYSALYLRLMSETFPGEVDLFWLSYRFASQVSDSSLEPISLRIQQSYFDHLYEKTKLTLERKKLNKEMNN